MFHIIEYKGQYCSLIAGRNIEFSKSPNDAIRWDDEEAANKVVTSIKPLLPTGSVVTVRKAKEVVELI